MLILVGLSRRLSCRASAGDVRPIAVRYPRTVPKSPEHAVRLKDRTLTKLYNTPPAWLANAHARLDAAVCAAYGWPATVADDDLLAKLLALNLSRAGSVAPPPAEADDE